MIGIFIGAVTFNRSIVAYLKLSAKMNSKPLMLPARTRSTSARSSPSPPHRRFVASPGIVPVILATVLALFLGCTLVASIGGGDMPVVVSKLTRTPAAGRLRFLLGNDALIITVALVGSSGAY